MEEKDKLVYTVTEAAELLRISRPTAFMGVKKGQIPHIRVGTRILIPAAAIRKLLENAGTN